MICFYARVVADFVIVVIIDVIKDFFKFFLLVYSFSRIFVDIVVIDVVIASQYFDGAVALPGDKLAARIV